MMTEHERNKQAIKEGLQEWLNEKFSEFGKFSMRALLAFLLVALVYIWSSSQGWKL